MNHSKNITKNLFRSILYKSNYLIFASASSALLFYFNKRKNALAEPNQIKTSVFTFGSGQYYQTGLGNIKNTPLPTRVNYAYPFKITQISAGGQQTFLLTDNGRVFSFGRGEDYRLGHGGDNNESMPRMIENLEQIIMVSVGEKHIGAVTENGELFTWGKNVFGQLGHEFCKIPQKVESLNSVHIRQVSCGKAHTLALTSDGRVFSCGLGRFGALGHGDKGDKSVFTEIKALKDIKISQIAAGEDFSLFLSKNGEVYSCGSTDFGQTGNGQAERYIKIPKLVTALSGHFVDKIEAGNLHAAASTSNGELFTWGENKTGQLGQGDNFIRTLPNKVDAFNGMKVKNVACGGHHTAVLVSDSKCVHRAFVFGDGRSGQLGRGDNIESVAAYRDKPVEITDYFTRNKCYVEQISLGSDHSVCLCDNVN